ncbi:undecaprenyldiphospho-muramoylpentapeptide beta-N-acetylglucosaminyltransferase [Allohahella sp. A8]|uniref:undecaprenyldiphospho-muramoylpentapeptide beta-N-acetylglucosaminyltransferase n=1 Tax=Allohahella sp. A8 TaxID=3141461 RepID=UPI000C09BB2C|nr:undecaprenyldiphospho-muramoylpentapeptide beta-N-acetylglucosaminyltransferase [Hahellaceae bacterium]|tara:strand:+ start:21722 stop:22840 length:1119 start_codon:yes stop_codon:yes gene_type:complete
MPAETMGRGPTVLIMAGGTGGHIFPGLSVAKVLETRGAEVTWLGSKAGMEVQVVPKHGFKLKLLDISGVRGKSAGSWLKAPFQLVRSVAQACAIIRDQQPDCVLGLGGFASGPGGIAAWLMRRPLVLHEQNAVPGTTNRWLATVADRVFEGFEGTFKGSVRARAEWVGNPVRTELVDVSARRRHRTAGAARHLLVLGGSRGAQVLNEILPQALANIEPAQRPKVLHQAGAGKAAACQALYDQLEIEAEVVEFIDDMAKAYEHAAVAVCRAGALTIAELAVTGVPAVLVPYPHAIDDHQTRNAETMVAANAARLIDQRDLNAQGLAQLLEGLLGNHETLSHMGQAAEAVARIDAATTVADYCLSVCTRELAHA